MGDSSVRLGVYNGRRLNIELDRPNGAYSPSEHVSGKVLTDFARSKRIQGLRIVVVGESVVKWSAGSEKSDADGHYHEVFMTSREDYFSSEFFLIGSDSGPGIDLPSGQLAYPFNFQLPDNLPSSFEHEFGYVRYKIKAYFYKRRIGPAEVETAFPVLATYNLNWRPVAALSIREEVDNSFCWMCCCPTGSLRSTISIPFSGYVPGQMIRVTVECDNDSSVEVEKMKIQLWRVLKFHATTPRWSHKDIEEVVTQNECMYPFERNDVSCAALQLTVPPLPPSGLEYCGIIDLDYVLRVVLCFDGMHCRVERRFPILVGTVPVRYSESFLSSTIITPPSPSAPPSQQSPPINVTMPFPGVPPPGNISAARPLGFVVNNPPYPSHGVEDPYNSPPPSYEACMRGSKRGV